MAWPVMVLAVSRDRYSRRDSWMMRLAVHFSPYLRVRCWASFLSQAWTSGGRETLTFSKLGVFGMLYW